MCWSTADTSLSTLTSLDESTGFVAEMDEAEVARHHALFRLDKCVRKLKGPKPTFRCEHVCLNFTKFWRQIFNFVDARAFHSHCSVLIVRPLPENWRPFSKGYEIIRGAEFRENTDFFFTVDGTLRRVPTPYM